MADEVKPGLATTGTEGASAASTTTDEQKPEEKAPSTFDADALARRVEEVSSNSATKAEIESLRRQAGHVPALQSELATVKAELEQRKADAERLDALELMLMSSLPVDEAVKLETARSERVAGNALDQRFDAVMNRLEEIAPKGGGAANEEAPDPRVAAYQAAASEATAAVHAYATEHGIDPVDIPAEVYQRAALEAKGDLVAASQSVAAWIDEKATAIKSEANRVQRASDAAGGDPKTREGAAGQYDLNTVSGLSAARRDGAITSEQFIEGYRKVRGGI